MSAVETSRREASLRLEARHRALMGQFLTPAPVAMFMARMIECKKPVVRLLDPGAGLGSLSAAFVAEMCRRQVQPDAIAVTACELDPMLIDYLRSTLELCKAVSEDAGIRFEARILAKDFLEVGANTFVGDLFAAGENERFDCAILNPPYRKIRTESRERKLLRALGLETSNLYTGFLAVTVRFLTPDGEMVAITPRSFCNGPYFEPFRRFFLKEMRFRRIHVLALFVIRTDDFPRFSCPVPETHGTYPQWTSILARSIWQPRTSIRLPTTTLPQRQVQWMNASECRMQLMQRRSQ